MNASKRLQGLVTDDGWKIVSPIKRNASGSGGTFSDSYIVERDGKKAFLKAFDFAEAFDPGAETLEIMEALITAYQHERDILKTCREANASNIVVSIGHGSVQVPNLSNMEGRVYYLIFEMADGDIRGQVSSVDRFDSDWSLRALKCVALGLSQVHRQLIAHQDIKPSNVLIFPGPDFKIADFGRSACKGRSIWHDERTVAGDKSYSPPELLYGFGHPDFVPRRIGCDMYMLGNLCAFMFTGVNVTGNLLANLNPDLHWTRWGGTYHEVLPYIQEAFARTVEQIAEQIDPAVRDEIVKVIIELCNPDLASRGAKRTVGRTIEQYSVNRYVARFELLRQRLSIYRRIGRRAG